MRRIVSIAFLSAALLVLTTLSLVPHHHHRVAADSFLELCESGRTDNVQPEHDAAREHAEAEGCVAHALFASAKLQNDVATPDTLPLQAVGQVVLSSTPAPAAVGLPAEYGLFIPAYKSVSPNPGSGLRAPPCLS